MPLRPFSLCDVGRFWEERKLSQSPNIGSTHLTETSKSEPYALETPRGGLHVAYEKNKDHLVRETGG